VRTCSSFRLGITPRRLAVMPEIFASFLWRVFDRRCERWQRCEKSVVSSNF
jgi:hypothetical protein